MSAEPRRLRPPRGGAQPPATVTVAGEPLFLAPLAHEVARRYFAEFPDDRDRYGDAGFDWAVHDTQYLLYWASLGEEVFAPNLRWLCELLDARGFPAERLTRNLELAADVVAEQHPASAALAAVLRSGA